MMQIALGWIDVSQLLQLERLGVYSQADGQLPDEPRGPRGRRHSVCLKQRVLIFIGLFLECCAKLLFSSAVYVQMCLFYIEFTRL